MVEGAAEACKRKPFRGSNPLRHFYNLALLKYVNRHFGAAWAPVIMNLNETFKKIATEYPAAEQN